MDPDDLPDSDPPSPHDILANAAIELQRATIDAVPDEYLTRLLAVYHDEWERRHDERWILAE